MSRGKTRTEGCGSTEGRTRATSAGKFLEVARLLQDKAQYGMIHVSRNDLKVAMR